eukprot:1155673-Pelagomonas_calceolata.AAC.1
MKSTNCALADAFAPHLQPRDLSLLECQQVMNLLGDLYKEYDERAVELGLYTVDTIGDFEPAAVSTRRKRRKREE